MPKFPSRALLSVLSALIVVLLAAPAAAQKKVAVDTKTSGAVLSTANKDFVLAFTCQYQCLSDKVVVLGSDPWNNQLCCSTSDKIIEEAKKACPGSSGVVVKSPTCLGDPLPEKLVGKITSPPDPITPLPWMLGLVGVGVLIGAGLALARSRGGGPRQP